MAIAWIREIRNHHPNATVRVRVVDDGRHPSLNGVTYYKDDWMVLGPPSSEHNPKVATPENMAVPWSYGGKQRLVIQTEINGVHQTVSAEIRGRLAWDWMLLRDGELRVLTRDGNEVEIDAGSQGDAPGINHSWWAIVLHSNGQLEFHQFEYQGVRRDDVINFLNAAGSFYLTMLDKVVNITKDLAPLMMAV